MKEILNEYLDYLLPSPHVFYDAKEKDEVEIKEIFPTAKPLKGLPEEQMSGDSLIILIGENFKTFNEKFKGAKLLTDNDYFFEKCELYQHIGNISYEKETPVFSQVRTRVEDNEFYVLKIN